jgi:nitrogen regulatory protein P-II 1
MKQITAVVKLDKLDVVARAVEEVGAGGLTATEVGGFGQRCGHMATARPADQMALILPKLRMDVLVHDELTDPVVEAIAKGGPYRHDRRREVLGVPGREHAAGPDRRA